MTEDAVTKRSDKLWRHVLGSTKFEPIYDEKDELYDIEIGKTRDKKYLFLRHRSQGYHRSRAICAPTGRPDDFHGVSAAREGPPLLPGSSRRAVLYPDQ